MRTIPLNKGYEALVDDEDYAELIRHRWFVSESGSKVYACRQKMVDYARSSIYMHRQILGVPPDVYVDHKNGNGLDNQRNNIRPATNSQNQQNRPPASGCSSIYTGVCWQKNRHTWNAYITINRRRIHLGVFYDEESAAVAYEIAAREVFGEYAYNPTS